LDLEKLNAELTGNIIDGLEGFFVAEQTAARLRAESPMVSSQSIDVVVSNCVLNLIDPVDKQQMFDELFRVLKPAGRAVISDIVSSDDVPVNPQDDPELWSGCISGALLEDKFLHAFADAGLEPIRIFSRSQDPWQNVREIEFRSMTIEAIKDRPKENTTSYFTPRRKAINSSCC